eukprot:COSAG05_NODE_11893_length_491_cov_1.135204_1_plen_24_part_01
MAADGEKTAQLDQSMPSSELTYSA